MYAAQEQVLKNQVEKMQRDMDVLQNENALLEKKLEAKQKRIEDEIKQGSVLLNQRKDAEAKLVALQQSQMGSVADRDRLNALQQERAKEREEAQMEKNSLKN